MNMANIMYRYKITSKSVDKLNKITFVRKANEINTDDSPNEFISINVYKSIYSFTNIDPRKSDLCHAGYR